MTSPIPWVRIAIAIAVGLLVYFAIYSMAGSIKRAIFGDPEVQRERSNTVVAKEQGQAEANIADKTIERVKERDVYREHVTNIVREAQENVNEVNKGQQMDPEIDAAVAAGLCRVHDSLCRQPRTEEVQPVREPVSGADRTR